MSITYDTTTGLRALLGGNLISDIDQGFLDLATDIVARLGAFQAGVWDAGSFMVTQRAAGATQTVDVASNSGKGCFVAKTSTGSLIFIAANGSATNVAVTAAHATLPRIDIVTVSTAGVVAVTAGTATSGATLANRTGAASVPSDALLLADILVGATVTSITNSVIRDRRTWARGAYRIITRNANASAGSDYTTTAATLALIDSTNIAPRIECSGVPLRVRLLGTFSQSTTAADYLSPQVDSLGVDGMGNVGDNMSGTPAAQSFAHNSAALGNVLGALTWEFTPAAGSHVIAPAWATSAGTLTLGARSTRPMQWIVEEVLRPNTANNLTTSG